MKSWLVSYANSAFFMSLKNLMESARRYGIDELHPWDREALERTILYKMHKPVLDLRRGAGYWLWKPFIICRTLKEAGDGDIVVYSDAGMEITGDLSPLFDFCLQKEITLFAGHYDDIGSPGPNVCAKWTKRDCFVFMDCDEPFYYQSQMLDASLLVLKKTDESMALVREWFLYCCQSHLLTDQPSVCGLGEPPGFIEHRHDQSILSLLAARNNIEIFRHPSQYGNHLKDEPYRQPGEWVRYAYGAKGVYHNSPYPTLFNHHRGKLSPQSLLIRIHRIVQASQPKVFDAWTEPERVKEWFRPEGFVVKTLEADLHVGGQYRLVIENQGNGNLVELLGEYLEVYPPARLVYRWYRSTRVTVEFHDRGNSTEVVLVHEFIPSEKLRYLYNKVWNISLDRLAEQLDTSVS